jgi:hypothetical protein
MMLRRDQLRRRECPDDVGSKTLVQGHRMLLRQRSRESSRMFTAAWRRYYKECLEGMWSQILDEGVME